LARHYRNPCCTPSLNHGPARGSAHRSRKGLGPEYQRGDFGDRFCRSAWHSHNPAFQGPQPTPGELIAEGATRPNPQRN
jgi:hypothetical protein